LSGVLRLYDTRAGQVREIEPVRRGQLRLFACGPVGYRRAHLGDLRTLLLPDLIGRIAQRHRITVLTCWNITDVGFRPGDDGALDALGQPSGIIRNGLPRGPADPPSAGSPAEAHEASARADAAALNIHPPDLTPRASGSVAAATGLIERLIAGGHAYAAPDGSVYCAAASFDGYGEPAGLASADEPRNVSPRAGPGDTSRAAGGEPQEAGGGPRAAGDWVAWAGVADGAVPDGGAPDGGAPDGRGPDGGGPGWAAPWGAGVPSWHVACSAMSGQALGDVVDIHTGAIAQRFPHHENERVQSDAATGHEVVRCWVHGEDTWFDGTAFGRSATADTGAGSGDVSPAALSPAGVSLSDAGGERSAATGGGATFLVDVTGRGLDPLALRLVFLEHHYREPLNLTWLALAEADRTLRGWRDEVARWATHPSRPMSAEHVTRIAAAFDDDLDTPAALGVLRTLAAADDVPAGARFETFAHVDALLGLDLARDVGRY
jgi:cysteinyl-tRNA synthetase